MPSLIIDPNKESHFHLFALNPKPQAFDEDTCTPLRGHINAIIIIIINLALEWPFRHTRYLITDYTQGSEREIKVKY